MASVNNLNRLALHALSLQTREPPRFNDPCEKKCVPFYYKNDDPVRQKECSIHKEQDCYIPREQDEKFYRAINWERLVKLGQGYMNLFAEFVTQDEEIGQLMRDVYRYGPYSNRQLANGIPSDFAYFEANVEDNDDFKHCGNMIIKLVLNVGGKRQNIAHISLHPRHPKYHRDTLRSRSGCGFYERKEEFRLERGQTSHPTDTGPFHYIIDTFYWGDKGPRKGIDYPSLELIGHSIITGAFNAEPREENEDARIFQPSVDEFPVVLPEEVPDDLDKEIEKAKARSQAVYEASLEGMTPAQKKKALKKFMVDQIALVRAEKERLIREYYMQNMGNEETVENVKARRDAYRVQLHRQELLKLHTLLYEAFVEFWNTKMIPIGGAGGMLSIKRYVLKFKLGSSPAKGGTRKYKRRNKQTRRLVSHKHK